MTYDSWRNQGRQEHGWFGHGTSPHDDKPARPNPPAPDTPERRATVASYGAVAHMKRDLARPYEIALQYGMNGDFQTLVAAHPVTASLGDEAYHAEILDGRLTRPQVAHLRDAVALTHGARTLDDLDAAAKAMGDLVVSAGLHNTRGALATAAAATAPIIKASATLAAPAARLAYAVVDTALEIIATAVAEAAAVPLTALAVAMAAGWGLYELIADYDPRLIHPIKVPGHPEIQAVIDETQGKVALAIPGPSGRTASVLIWKVETLPDTSVLTGMPPIILLWNAEGKEMGYSAVPGRITLSAAGAEALKTATVEGTGGIKPKDDEERKLAEAWAAEGKTPLEIQILLDARQNSSGGGGAGAEQDKGKVNVDSRNKGLPEQLWTRKGYREAAIANDKPLAEAIATGKVSGSDARSTTSFRRRR